MSASTAEHALAEHRQRKHARRAKRKHVRAKLRHAALTKAPLWLSRGRIIRGRSICHIHPAERDIFIPNLPESLDGLRITHLSDLHIGLLTRPERLPELVEHCHRLEGDLIAVTGDLVDLSHSVLDDVLASMCRLIAPLGVYFVPGNHDYLEDAPGFVRRVRDAGLNLLVNDAVNVEARGCRVLVAGIDYAHQLPELTRLVRRTLRQAGKNNVTNGENGGNGNGGNGGNADLRLLLAHHPDAFEAARQVGVELTLSGHTHGGQLKLSNQRGKKGSVGLGSMAFRYPHGLYRHGDCHLHVTSGVGSWFPLRVKCPAEIVRLTLHRGHEPVNQPSHP